jgi:predicted site-specific integrase-resolvase
MRNKENVTERTESTKLLGVQECAEHLGISPWTVRRYAYNGTVASVKLSTRLLIPVSEIERLIAERMRPAMEKRA